MLVEHMISKYIYIPDYVLVFVGEGMFFICGRPQFKALL